jgi:uncharacterized membrane protein
MNAAHVHLLLNHVPVLGIIFGLLLLAYAIYRRQEDLMRAGLGFLVLSAVVAVAVYLTGEPAEEVVEGMAGISEAAIEAHEEVAVFALIGTSVLGLFALGVLLRFRQHLPRWAVITAMGLSVAVTGVTAWTSYLGGEINHPELASPAGAAGEQQADYEQDED